jgi:NAD(P)-dependent dehydrogenase (short-subunit alcohol dehydrogenase family)
MDVLLQDKSAVVYGGGGSVGGAVARAFAREGARVFLAGRTLATVERVASEITAAGGQAQAAQVDALDEEAVDRYADAVAEQAGGIDVSFNAISHGDVHGAPLLDMPFEDFVRPIATAMRAQFLTSRAAARHMVERGSGVIMAVTATTARQVIPEVGGTGVSFDAIESQCRQWASELGPRGVRVVWLQTTGIPDGLHADVFPAYGTGASMTREELVAWMRGKTMLGRLTSLADVGNAAAFLASDLAGPITANGVNVSAGAAPG